METAISLSSLVRPKFASGQFVFAVDFMDNSRTKINRIHRVRIDRIEFKIEIEKDRQGVEQRNESLTYVAGSSIWNEAYLFASLDDIPSDIRKAAP